MDLNFDLNLVKSQKLLLTPQLKQAIGILKMNSQELFGYISEQIELNPVLEAIENQELDEESPEIPDLDLMGYDASGPVNELIEKNDEVLDDIDPFEFETGVRQTLKDYLLTQLQIAGLDEDSRKIGEYLIGNVDENGYLLCSLSEAATRLKVSTGNVDDVLKVLQSFDPPGICARSLKECLAIQLKQMENANNDVMAIVENHLGDLASNRIAVVAKKTGLSVQKVVDGFKLIKSLEPKPGRAFYNDYAIRSLIPDVFVKNIRNKYEVFINEEAFPVLNTSSYYKRIAYEDVSEDTRTFILNKMDSARWIIKCVENRRNTILKIAEVIVNHQQEFFNMGRFFINPMNLKMAARETNIHESILAGMLPGKYILCRWGIFEMDLFFGRKARKHSGNEYGPEKIRAVIMKIIKSEDPKKPVSDGDIAKLLKNDGLEVSVRTVNKYRTIMNIPPAFKRRKL